MDLNINMVEDVNNIFRLPITTEVSNTDFLARSKSLVLLDFDNSLVPSDFIKDNLDGIKSPSEIRDTHKHLFDSCESNSLKLLKTLVESPNNYVFIVTNAKMSWVQYVLDSYFLELGPYIYKHVQVISARDLAHSEDNDITFSKSVLWKLNVFMKLTQLLRDKHHGRIQIVSIGDSWSERAALMKMKDLYSAVGRILTKSIKINGTDPAMMIEQLGVLNTFITDLLNCEEHIDAEM